MAATTKLAMEKRESQLVPIHEHSGTAVIRFDVSLFLYLGLFCLMCLCIYIYIHTCIYTLDIGCADVWVLDTLDGVVCVCSSSSNALASSNECLLDRTLNVLVSFVFYSM